MAKEQPELACKLRQSILDVMHVIGHEVSRAELCKKLNIPSWKMQSAIKSMSNLGEIKVNTESGVAKFSPLTASTISVSDLKMLHNAKRLAGLKARANEIEAKKIALASLPPNHKIYNLLDRVVESESRRNSKNKKMHTGHSSLNSIFW
jgi:hypothetical protein